MADATNETGGFDRVEVTVNGELRAFTRAEFAALSLAERVRMLLDAKVSFFRNGVAVSSREAMRGD
jgi:hypothetical protein